MSLKDEFEAFHLANPHIYGELKKLALDWKHAGHLRGSINMFFEVLRHRRGLATSTKESKLPNNHRAFYARVLMAANSELRGFFVVHVQEVEYRPNLEALGLRKRRRRKHHRWTWRTP